jgi:hypothetical protein
MIRSTVNPYGDASARFEECGQAKERLARIGRVIEYADRIDMVEASTRKWQTKQVGSHEGHLGQIRRQLSRGHNRLAEIETDDQFRPQLGRDTQVAPHAAATVEHALAPKIGRRQPSPIEKRRPILVWPQDAEPIPLKSVRRLGASLVVEGHGGSCVSIP